MDIKEKINKTPLTCGVYLIKDAKNSVIYVGKATSIRNRLKAHFVKKASFARQHALTETAADIDYIPTSSPEAALLLEAALIKKYSPKFNVALKDDKSYPVLKLTINEEFPRLIIARRKADDGALYFGPYTNAKLLRKALKLVGRIFPLRKCSNPPGKPCLYYHLGQCLGPCSGTVSKDDYKKIAEKTIMFLEGESEKLISALAEDMKDASDKGKFEYAARLRDEMQALSSLIMGTATNFSSGKKMVAVPIMIQLEDLKQQLKLAKIPETIEAFDISNIMGKEAVGSMIVFKNGKPFNGGYRRFKIRTVEQIDDYSMMAEIVGRRYYRLLKDGEALPDLIVIDGGKGHLMSAKKQLHKMRIWQVPVIAIAKSFELIYTQEAKEPLGLDPASPASLLVQRIRDEAHRFAINYHRLLRGKKVFASELDNIAGLGPKKKRLLLEHFGSVDEIKMAEIDDLAKVKYINEKQASKIYDYFKQV